jgi:hypothetical protein
MRWLTEKFIGAHTITNQPPFASVGFAVLLLTLNDVFDNFFP